MSFPVLSHNGKEFKKIKGYQGDLKVKARRCSDYLERSERIQRSLLILLWELESKRGSVWDWRDNILVNVLKSLETESEVPYRVRSSDLAWDACNRLRPFRDTLFLSPLFTPPAPAPTCSLLWLALILPQKPGDKSRGSRCRDQAHRWQQLQPATHQLHQEGDSGKSWVLRRRGWA